MSLTRKPAAATIDVGASQDNGMREAIRELRERAGRELRYTPKLTGKIVLTIHYKLGVPMVISAAVEKNEPLTPIT